MRYEPNDSPFGLTYANWQRCEPHLRQQFLAQFSNYDLDEFQSCATTNADKPIYADDGDLTRFAEDANAVLVSRL
jgi:hypothetical protein